MFCPNCKAEYRDGFYKCADCNEDLTYELPVEEEVRMQDEDKPGGNLKTVQTYMSEAEASVALSFLVSNGINGILLGDNHGMRAYGSCIRYNKLMVDEKDVDRAKELLDSSMTGQEEES